MEFTKLCSPSLKELFITQLEHMILSGKLKIGEKLPPERQLAEAMQVSRAVVNGGITELEKKGFLIIRPRVGTFVADYRQNGTLDTLISIMNYNGGRFRDEEIRSILEVRAALGVLAVQLCRTHFTEKDAVLLQNRLNEIHNATSHETAALAAFGFHHDLALVSGNTLLPLIFQSFKVPVLTLWERFCTLYGIEALYRNTFSLWTQLEQGNWEDAIAFINHSLDNTINGSRPIYYD
ncbi:GntR family transcriptional regulator [Anaerocolumna sp. AGMB13020]|uniref:FadR/GntR family transcriptional regulator n=1 Tax=Anaerocolumna sp. AGMB13020 TaxID=3081750 RepID=UPI002953F028|nr:GntR family transcriptional regulator [Anaerocolumna sp. AGMB13020]WOO35074.1 GntR family transcriptional regulator [Anaerocolumna sp. AGMB13020]